MRGRPVIREVADGVLVATGTHVSWTLVLDGGEVTLVDAGYLGDADAVQASIWYVRPRATRLAAIVLTHAHVDHLGTAGRLSTLQGVPVLAHEDEVAHVRGDVVEQVTTAQVLARSWRPRVLRWSLGVLRAGGPRAERVRSVVPFQAGAALDVPGGLVPVPTPGHTSGHCAFHLPDRGVLLAGDALCNGHPVTARQGPQLPPEFFQHDAARARESLRALEPLDADVIVPGHGPPIRSTPAEAVRLALGGAAVSPGGR